MLKIPAHLLVATLVAIGIASTAATVINHGFDPDSACVGNARMLAVGVSEYIQDYDEDLPNLKDSSTFQAALVSYVRFKNRLFYCPATGKAYAPNAQLSGLEVYRYADTSNTPIFEDAVEHIDGKTTVGELDGSVRVNGEEISSDGNEQVCVSKGRSLGLALIQYVEDYDGRFPNMSSLDIVKPELDPYLRDPEAYQCPGSSTQLNPNPALSYKLLTNFPDQKDTETFSDADGSAGHVPTTVYLDTHVVHGTRYEPSNSYATPEYLAIKQISDAMESYAWDNGDHLPPLDSYPAFVNSIKKYVTNPTIFDLVNGKQPYELNASLSGLYFIYLPEQWVVRASYFNDDGSREAVDTWLSPFQEIDFRATSLTTDCNGDPALIWSKIGISTESSELYNPTGGVVTNLSPLGAITNTESFNDEFIPNSYYIDATPLAYVSTLRDHQRILSFSNSITANYDPLNFGPSEQNIWSTDTSGNIVSKIDVGPYDGWQAVGLAQSSAGIRRMLWRFHTGELALWTTDSTGQYVSDVRIAPDDHQKPVGMAIGTDGHVHILLETEHRELARLLTFDVASNMIGDQTYTSDPGDRVISLAVGQDNGVRLLWSRKVGGAKVTTLTADGQAAGTIYSKLGNEYTPTQLAIERHEWQMILWRKIGAVSALTVTRPDGVLLSTKEYDPFETTP